mmetsp:Transcript_33947/g.82309  ORF Transcript_33947/g.82309 Transcript_33947/m.82309 type:complete len:211 (-) Transcript_33947:1158-1790(-)
MRGHSLPLGSREEAVAHPFRDPPCPAGPLGACRFGGPRLDEPLHLPGGVILGLLHLSSVNDVRDVGDRDGGLGDVGAEDDLDSVPGCFLEDVLLLCDREGAVELERPDLDVPPTAAAWPVGGPCDEAGDAVGSGLLLQGPRERLDLVCPGEEDEDPFLRRGGGGGRGRGLPLQDRPNEAEDQVLVDSVAVRVVDSRGGCDHVPVRVELVR